MPRARAGRRGPGARSTRKAASVQRMATESGRSSLGPRRSVAPLAVPLVLLAVANVLGVAFAPVLAVEAPLALIALSPLVRHLVLIVPAVDPAPLFVIGALRLFAADPFVFVLGRRYGPRTLSWLSGRAGVGGRLAPAIMRLFDKASTLVLLINPGVLVCTLCGVSGMSWARFAVVNCLGTFGLLTLVLLVGRSFEAWIALVLAFVARHMLSLTLASVALVVVGGLLWWRRFRRAGGSLGEMLR